MKTKIKMKKQLSTINAFIIMAGLSTFLLLNGCTDSKKMAQYEQENQAVTAENDSLKNVLNEKEVAINNFMESFNAIEQNLASIKEKEQLIEMKKNDPELKPESKEGIIRDIQLINTLMEKNRKTIALMKENLNKAGLKINAFEKQVAQLTEKLDAKDNAINHLKEDLTNKNFEIALLNNVVDTLSNQVDMQKEFIQTQDKALYTSYVAKGTYKELKENGVIETNGLFPWADRNKKLNEEPPQGQFKKVDLREFTSVPVNATKADLITNHPKGSYEFKEGADGQIASLEITRPDEFWKLSHYLVLEVK